MLIRASGPLQQGFYLLTLGESCHYAIEASDPSGETRPLILFDPGTSVHCYYLAERLKKYGISLQNVECVLLTHLHAERMSGIPYLKREAPRAQFFTSSTMAHRISKPDFLKECYQHDLSWRESLNFDSSASPLLSFDQFREALVPDRIIAESESFAVDTKFTLRAIGASGHTPDSLAFFIQPYDLLIVDEGCGYSRGRLLTAPGADYSVAKTIETLRRFASLQINALCLPSSGVITGELVRPHLTSLIQNMEDILVEAKKARDAGLAEDHIRNAIREAFYLPESADPVVRHSLQRSFQALLPQLTN